MATLILKRQDTKHGNSDPKKNKPKLSVCSSSALAWATEAFLLAMEQWSQR
jgi:hypothetical protein